MIKRIIRGKLKNNSSFYIGSGETTEFLDTYIIRDSKNNIIIPGTSIAGSLRSYATRIAPHFGVKSCIRLEPQETPCYCPVCKLFGSSDPKRNVERGFPSKIWVYDAVLDNYDEPEIRDGIAVDRESQSAFKESKAKFNFEVLPRNSEFSFHIEVEELEEEFRDIQNTILGIVLKEWQDGRCFLGGMRSRGLGEFILEDLTIENINLTGSDDLIALLKHNPNTTKVSDYIKNSVQSGREKIKENSDSSSNYTYNSFFTLNLKIQFIEGIVVNDPKNSVRSNFDHFPKFENGAFVIPGSSLRGAIRNHAEKIVRTITTEISDNEEEFLNKCPACNPGAGAKSNLTSCNEILKEEAALLESEVLIDRLCLACQTFGSSFLGSRLYISDGIFDNSFPILMKKMDFVAIDRFTGGGKLGAKFDAALLWNPKFEFKIFMENPKKWELGWLMLVLKDIIDSQISVGAGQNKWFGKTSIDDKSKEEITIKFGFINENFTPITKIPEQINDEAIFSVVNYSLQNFMKNSKDSINSWINDFHAEVNKFLRNESYRPKNDSYFKGEIPELYPKSKLTLEKLIKENGGKNNE